MPGIYTWASVRTGKQNGKHHAGTGAKKKWVMRLSNLNFESILTKMQNIYIPQVHPWRDPHDQSCFPPERPAQRDHRDRVQQNQDPVFLQRKPQPDRTWQATSKNICSGQQTNLVEENWPGFFGNRYCLKPPLVAPMQPRQISLLVRTNWSKEWTSAKCDAKWTESVEFKYVKDIGYHCVTFLSL